MTKKTQEVQIIDLDKFNTSQLPELQNKKAELKKAIDEYPFVEITDNASYELAKKSRTGVKTIRTALEKEKKMVVGKIKENILNKVSEEYDNLLLEDVKPIEEKHQAEVTRWEDIKEQERLEKIRIEEERISGIKSKIVEFEENWSESFSNMTFEDIEDVKKQFSGHEDNFDYDSLQEFAIEFKAKLAFLRTKLEDRVKVLTEKEEIRLEQERLENERKESQRILDIQNRIGLFYNAWYGKIHGATIQTIASLQEELRTLKPIDVQEFQSDYEEKKSLLETAMDEKFRTLHTAEEQRIAQEKFLEEKRQFEEEKKTVRASELKALGFEIYGGDFTNKLTNTTYTILHLSYPQEQWDELIKNSKKNIEEVKRQAREESKSAQLEDAKLSPITEEQSFEPETNVEDSDFIQEVNFEEIEETAFNVEKMTFEEKQSALIDWISKREEHELDALIKQYLN